MTGPQVLHTSTVASLTDLNVEESRLCDCYPICTYFEGDGLEGRQRASRYQEEADSGQAQVVVGPQVLQDSTCTSALLYLREEVRLSRAKKVSVLTYQLFCNIFTILGG